MHRSTIVVAESASSADLASSQPLLFLFFVTQVNKVRIGGTKKERKNRPRKRRVAKSRDGGTVVAQ